MKDLEVKKNILQEIMDLMDSREGDRLKSHPKLMAAQIEVGKPEDEEKDPMDKFKEDSPEEEKSETPDFEAKEDESSEVSPEMLQALLEKFKGLK